MDKIILVRVTEAEHKALRVLAANMGETLQSLMRRSIARSVVTREALQAAHDNGGEKQ